MTLRKVKRDGGRPKKGQNVIRGKTAHVQNYRSAQRRVSGSSEPPRLPEPPAWLGCGDQPILGRQWILCAWPPSGRHRLALQHRVAADRLTDQRRVHCKLGSPLQRQTIHNHFKSSRFRDRPACWCGLVLLPPSISWQPHSPKRSHARPTLPPAHKLHDDGHRSQVEGDIGSCGQTGGEPVGDDARGSRGRDEGELWSPDWSEPLSVPLLLQRTSACTVSFLHPGAGFVLTTKSHRAWFEVVGFPEWWSCPRSCCFPTGRFKSHDTSELTTSHLCGLQNAGVLTQQADCNPCLPEQKAWKQLRPRRPLALEIRAEFCKDTPTPRRRVSDKTRLPSGAQPLWPHGSPERVRSEPEPTPTAHPRPWECGPTMCDDVR